MTDKLTTEQLDEWGALAKAATPGDWRVVKNRDGTVNVVCDYSEAGDRYSTKICLVNGKSENAAVFIAASRAAVPALIAEVDRLETELEAAQSPDLVAMIARAERAERELAVLGERAGKAEAERDEAILTIQECRSFVKVANEQNAMLMVANAEFANEAFERVSPGIKESEAERDAALARESKLREALEALCVQGEHVVLGHFCRMPVIDGAVREMSVLIDAARAALNGE